MKNIYNDNQIMSPQAMDKIIHEFFKQKIETTVNIDDKTKNMLQENLKILEYINTYNKNISGNLQKCLIKTFAILKDCNSHTFNMEAHSNTPINQSKYRLFINSLEILQHLAKNYQKILTSQDYKTINVCIDTIEECLKF